MGHTWDPARFTLGTLGHVSSNSEGSYEDFYAVILLNHPLENPELALSLGYNAGYSIFADGGANRFRDMAIGGDTRFNLCPDVICGDFDSIRPDVLNYYQGQGAYPMKDCDEYSTDLMKSLKHASKVAEECLEEFNRYFAKWPKTTSMDVVVLGGLGGRVDQAFSQLHHLYMASIDSSLNLGDLYLVTGTSIIFLLQKGLNWIRTPMGPGFFTENVGIIPIGRPSVITTTGLEWDVKDWSTEFGAQISTSNHIKADVVSVKTTERVLFTLEFAESEEPQEMEKSERAAKRVKKENEPPP
ncbi:thiamine pyrophosphokinase [Physcia stellaris]|nr:thiamine pyrophosphokinase [Physcia stellaris]